MIKLKIKVNRKVINELNKRAKRLNAAGPYVKVGLLGNGKQRPDGKLTNPEIGVVHEFGSEDANIPKRPWLRPPVDARRSDFEKRIKTALAAEVIEGKPGEVVKVLGLVGLLASAAVKIYVTQGPPIPPPNSGRTLKRKEALTRKGSKGQARTLVDTGRMIGAVTHKVEQGPVTK